MLKKLTDCIIVRREMENILASGRMGNFKNTFLALFLYLFMGGLA